MGIKSPKPEGIVAKVRQVEVLSGQGCLGLMRSVRSARMNKRVKSGVIARLTFYACKMAI